MRRKEAMLSRERTEKEKLAQKIAAMEGKLLTGGGEKTIVDHTNEQQRALEQRRAEVAARFVHKIKNLKNVKWVICILCVIFSY